MSRKAEIYEKLRTVIDPELGIDIVNLGLIYAVALAESGEVTVTMTLTSQGCPLHHELVNGVRRAVESLPDVGVVNLDLVFEPAWNSDMMSDMARDRLS